MARKTKTFQLEGFEKQITVYELTVKQIIEFMQKDIKDTSLFGFKNQIEDLIPLASNLTMEEVYGMAPSEIKTIWNNFREINNTFFEMSQQLGLTSLLGDLKQAIIEDFGKVLVDSSKLDIPESVTTDTPSS